MSDKRSRSFSCAIGATLLMAMLTGCAAPASKQGTAEQPHSAAVREYRLENGLKLLVKPDRRAPVVVSQVWYKVGGSYEPDGLTGISHVLEHMMFKGTERLGPNEFSRIIAANGGRENAFTGRDYTAYFQQLEKSRLPIAFELEAERMSNLTLDPAEFAKEIEVVKEERRLRTEDRPESLTYEQFMAAAFRNSGYRNPIIGWPSDLDSMSAADLRLWYERYYAPNNATLVVVGDVDPPAVYELAQQHFGRIPARVVPPTPDPVEPPQRQSRRITVEAAANVPYLLLGYHVPSITTAAEPWEPYALDILAYILDGGKSARLNKELVRRQEVAAGIGVGYDPLARRSTLFLVDGNPAGGESVAQLEVAIDEQLRRLQEELVTQQELDRVKAQIVASKVFEADSVFAQAMRLGMLETIGLDWRLADQLTRRLRAVTAEQVRSVALKYLKPENLTVAVLEPVTGTQISGVISHAR